VRQIAQRLRCSKSHVSKVLCRYDFSNNTLFRSESEIDS
jgi:hypothetical protein